MNALTLLKKVLDYYEGRPPFDFHRLNDNDRSNESFDAWQVIADEIRAELAASGWQPFASAPKNGTGVWAYFKGHKSSKKEFRQRPRAMSIYWCTGDWRDHETPGERNSMLIHKHGGYWALTGTMIPAKHLPTHWMPLPPTPSPEPVSADESAGSEIPK